MSTPAMTYDSLTQDIKDYLERGEEEDVTALRQTPRVIANTQRSLSNRLKIQGYIDVLTGTLQAGVAVVTKPEGWRDTVSINIGTGTTYNARRTLRPRSYEYIRALYPENTAVGTPEFYADYDLEHWLLAPAPADAFPFEAVVHRLPDLLSASNQQNFLTKYAPNLLLYSCLAAMEAFLKYDERLPVWKTLAKEEFEAIDVEDLKRMIDRGAIRSTS